MENSILELLKWVAETYPLGAAILMLLGTLVALGQAIVALTPRKDDDELLEKLSSGIFGQVLKVLKSFAPYQKN